MRWRLVLLPDKCNKSNLSGSECINSVCSNISNAKLTNCFFFFFLWPLLFGWRCLWLWHVCWGWGWRWRGRGGASHEIQNNELCARALWLLCAGALWLLWLLCARALWLLWLLCAGALWLLWLLCAGALWLLCAGALWLLSGLWLFCWGSVRYRRQYYLLHKNG